MSLFSLIFGSKPKTAAIAKERLQLIIAHERNGSTSTPDFLALQQELMAVISKYVAVNPEDIKVSLEKQGNFEVLEVQHRHAGGGQQALRRVAGQRQRRHAVTTVAAPCCRKSLPSSPARASKFPGSLLVTRKPTSCPSPVRHGSGLRQAPRCPCHSSAPSRFPRRRARQMQLRRPPCRHRSGPIMLPTPARYQNFLFAEAGVHPGRNLGAEFDQSLEYLAPLAANGHRQRRSRLRIVHRIDLGAPTDQLADDVRETHEARHPQRQARVTASVDQFDRSTGIEYRLHFLKTSATDCLEQVNSTVSPVIPRFSRSG